jgi:hypothetical protein
MLYKDTLRFLKAQDITLTDDEKAWIDQLVTGNHLRFPRLLYRRLTWKELAQWRVNSDNMLTTPRQETIIHILNYAGRLLLIGEQYHDS